MRLIDADELKEVVRREMQEPWAKGMANAICKLLDAAAEYKIVPLTHCKDCKFCKAHAYMDGDANWYECDVPYHHHRGVVLPDCFCSDGVRKEEDENDSISDC